MRKSAVLASCLAVAGWAGLFHFAVDGAKILLIPGPHYSHVNFFATTGAALREDGHEVYILTTSGFQKNVEKHGLLPLFQHLAKEDEVHVQINPFVKKIILNDIKLGDICALLTMLSNFCKTTGRNQLLMDQVQAIGFDLVINDATMFYSCLYMIPYRFDLKYMSITVLHDPWTHGVTALPSVEPSQLLPFSNEMSFLERVTNFLAFSIVMINPMSLWYSKEHLSEFAPHREYKSFQQLVSESQMVLVNHDALCTGYPRVSAPNYRYIGGSSVKPARALPKELQEFADGAEFGLIVLSFGSYDAMQSVWTSYKGVIMEVLGSLPQRAIVQYGLDDVLDSPQNVHLVKWLPQNDLLGHPNTKVFITHGGNNGQLEAVYHGVPLLTMPFQQEQWHNAIQAQTRGFGITLDKQTLSQKSLHSSLIEILTNDTYSIKVKKCSAITKSMPGSQKTAVFWVNHILQFGGEHLRSPAGNMPLYKMLMLDVMGFFVALLILVVLIAAFLCRCTFRLMCRRFTNKLKVH